MFRLFIQIFSNFLIENFVSYELWNLMILEIIGLLLIQLSQSVFDLFASNLMRVMSDIWTIYSNFFEFFN